MPDQAMFATCAAISKNNYLSLLMLLQYTYTLIFPTTIEPKALYRPRGGNFSIGHFGKLWTIKIKKY